MSEKEAVDEAIRGDGVVGMDYVREVTAREPYRWDPTDSQSVVWSVPRGPADAEIEEHSLPQVRHQVVAYDYGLKENILRRLRQTGFGITVVPASTTAAEVLAMNPDGVFLSNGPGDPAGPGVRSRGGARG
jgi:carbamoyl-phosphate synthase small subunit